MTEARDPRGGELTPTGHAAAGAPADVPPALLPPEPSSSAGSSAKKAEASGDRSVPDRIADFEVVRRLGMGGMAEVFLARKRGAEGTYKLLVLKRILPDFVSSRRFRVMFAEEAQLATRLNHPNIVQVYEFQDYGDDGQLLSMEYVDGPDLRAFTKALQAEGGRISPPLAAYIAAEVAKGLHYAHERTDEGGAPLDIVHRDVSPQNILLSRDGAVKIADFGIATANLFRQETGVLKGKTGYMAPEQARGQKVDRRTDIYSLGVVLHELLTGRPLHGALEGDALLSAVRAGTVEAPSNYALDIPPSLDAIALQALARDPEDRFRTARDLSQALQRALFEMGELVDAHTLEADLIRVVGAKRTENDEAAQRTRDASRVDADGDATEGTPIEPLLLSREQGREVRHVAVVSIGIDGHTALTERLGEAGARGALERIVTTLEAIAFKRNMQLSWEREAGMVVRGRGVAGLLAHPTTAAADALWFVVDAREGIAAARADLDVELSARVGVVRCVATGRRDRSGHLLEHELALASLTLADILRDRAAQGASLVAGGLYRLVRRDFFWGDAPNIEIDPELGLELPAQMRVYSLLRGLTRDEKLQEVIHAPTELIGRDAEMGDLHAAYYSAVGERGPSAHAVVRVVSGELGIGKTALVYAFLSELPPDARVLRADCSQGRRDVPFGVVSDWLRELTGTTADQPIEHARHVVEAALGWGDQAEMRESVDRLAELCTGRYGEAFDEGEIEHRKQSILLGFMRLLSRVSAEGPLVVVVDGLQWCDFGTLELLKAIMDREEGAALLVLLLTRPDTRIFPYVEGRLRLDLAGLSPESQARLLQVRLGVGPGVERVCADIIPRAAGNPYFLLEMVDALLERGVLEIKETSRSTQELERVDLVGSVIALPSTLEQLLADRLTDLSEEEQRLIEWIAVMGGPLSAPELEQLYGLDADAVLEQLLSRGILERTADRIDVRHPLMRDVAYRSIGALRRQELHRAIGEHLAASNRYRGVLAAVVARHLAKGGLSDQAAELFLEAASVARGSYQMQAAARAYEKVISILPSTDRRLLEAYEALEAMARNEGRQRDRIEYLQKLRLLSKHVHSGYWVAISLLRSARYELDVGRLAKAANTAQLSEQAARLAGSEVLTVQSLSLAAEILRDLGDMQGALAAVDRALLVAQHPQVIARLRAEVLRTRGTLLRRVGRIVEAVEAYAESIAVFQQAGAKRMESRAKSSLSFALFALGRYEDGILIARDAMQIDAATGGRFQTAKTMANLGLCYAGAGVYEKGIQCLMAARDEYERVGERDTRADTLLSLSEVLLETGRIDEALTSVGDAAALIQVTGNRYDASHERILRALLARFSGRHAEATARALEARQGAESQAYASFQFYAMAIEAVSRVETGELHTGILQATTVLGAIEALQGSEYSLEARALACEALDKARSPQAAEMRRRSAEYTQARADSLREPALWKAFLERPPVKALLAPVRRTDSMLGGIV